MLDHTLPQTIPMAAKEKSFYAGLGRRIADRRKAQGITQVELAKTEIRQSVTQASKGTGMLGGAAVAGHMVLLFLSVALWWALGASIGRGWSAVVVALIWALIAAVLATMGRTQLKAVTGMPKTAETAKKIPDALKGNEVSR